MVKADTRKFYSYSSGDRWYCYNNKLKSTGVCNNGSRISVKKYTKKGKSRVVSYCGNRSKTLCDGCNHTLDKSWNSANTCVYYTYVKNKGTKHSDGDCSSIVGHILKQNYNWKTIQRALWSYLGNSEWGPSPYFYKDSYAIGSWNHSGDVRKIIKKAWQDYAASSGNSSASSTNASEANITVKIDDNNFYYIANGSSCGGTSGFYKTKNFSVKNTDLNTSGNGKVIKVLLDTGNSAIEICGAGINCDTSVEINLTYNNAVELYLKTTKIFSNSTVALPLEITASYIETQTVNNANIYDSKRYLNSKTKNFSAGTAQPMFVFEKVTGTSVIEVEHEFSKSFNFIQTPVSHNNACSVFKNSGQAIHDSNNKVCANNSSDSSRYIAHYKDCNCTSIELDNGSKVNVILNEEVYFKYGNLTPNLVYAGGGFGLALGNNDGISTAYSSKITWDYYDYVGNIPYYYNALDTTNYNANNVKNKIEEKLKQKIKNKSINFNFYSVDSNNPKDKNLVNRVNQQIHFSDKNISNFVSSNGNVGFSMAVDKIQLPNAYLSKNGDVRYSSSEKYYINGGNKYYIPLRYDGNKFSFNIGSSTEKINLNLMDGMSFKYNADCNVDVYNGTNICKTGDFDCNESSILGINYRTIDVSNPFPKYISANWKDWYNNSSNQIRLSNTFSNNPLYSISLDSNALNEIDKIQTSYSDWNNINKNGSSSFIINNFSVRANGDSYCEIGKFSSNCDIKK